jgi:uncharacterized protein YjbI with pentapeptide repeats
MEYLFIKKLVIVMGEILGGIIFILLFIFNPWIGVIGVGVTISILIIILAPIWKARKIDYLKVTDRWQAENEFRKTLIHIFGGFVIIIGVFFSWRQFDKSLEELNLSRYETEKSREEFQLAQENVKKGQISTRFSKAIDQLGGEGAVSKIGGIYTLEQVVKESPDYLEPVLDVLSAFVRQNEYPNNKDGAEDYKSILHETEAAMIVIGRIRGVNKNKVPNIDLRKARLKGISIERADLSGAILEEAILTEAVLVRAILIDANLTGAELINTKLPHVNLERAILEGAILTDAVLDRAILINANLTGANLKNAKLYFANLKEAILSDADLLGAEGLKVEQLIKVKTLYKVKGLKSEMEADLREKKPELFKEPEKFKKPRS